MPTSPNPALTYTVISATLDLDSFGKRTPSGKRYLNLTVRAACHATHSCYVGPESFRLLVGGQAQAAETLDPAADAVASDTQQDLRLAFLVPATDKSMVLQVGEATLGTAQIPLDLSGAP